MNKIKTRLKNKVKIMIKNYSYQFKNQSKLFKNRLSKNKFLVV